MPKGAAPGHGRTLPRDVKMFFFSFAMLATAPAENHLLHNGVAQVGIEEKINASRLAFPLSFLTPRLPESRSLSLQFTW